MNHDPSSGHAPSSFFLMSEAANAARDGTRQAPRPKSPPDNYLECTRHHISKRRHRRPVKTRHARATAAARPARARPLPRLGRCSRCEHRARVGCGGGGRGRARCCGRCGRGADLSQVHGCLVQDVCYLWAVLWRRLRASKIANNQRFCVVSRVVTSTQGRGQARYLRVCALVMYWDGSGTRKLSSTSARCFHMPCHITTTLHSTA